MHTRCYIMLRARNNKQLARDCLAHNEILNQQILSHLHRENLFRKTPRMFPKQAARVRVRIKGASRETDN